MAFTSLSFLIFFPIAALGYYLVPNRGKNLWLLCLSYYFYMCWNAAYALLLLFSTLTSYLFGLAIGRSAFGAVKKLLLL